MGSTSQSGHELKLRRRRNGDVEDADDPDTLLPEFAVECYAQSEAATISQNATTDPAGLLSFLDRFVGVAADLKEEREVRQALLDAEAREVVIPKLVAAGKLPGDGASGWFDWWLNELDRMRKAAMQPLG